MNLNKPIYSLKNTYKLVQNTKKKKNSALISIYVVWQDER